MKKGSAFKTLSAALFTAVIMLMVSYHEVHYLFVEHHQQHTHCDNHLHEAEDHCDVCKFDALFYTDELATVSIDAIPDLNEPVFTKPDSFIPLIRFPSNAQRGPPVIA